MTNFQQDLLYEFLNVNTADSNAVQQLETTIKTMHKETSNKLDSINDKLNELDGVTADTELNDSSILDISDEEDDQDSITTGDSLELELE